MSRALVTVAVGDVPEARWSHPVFAAYARRHGMEFVVIDRPVIRPGWLSRLDRRQRASLQKLQLHALLGLHERILYCDADVLLGPACPDLCALVSGGEIGAVSDERPGTAGMRRIELERAVRRLGPVARFDEPYFNAGMLVLGGAAREVFNPAGRRAKGRWPDQTTINYRARSLGVPVHYLHETYNFSPVVGVEWQDAEMRRAAHVVHYAGLADRPRMEEDGPWFHEAWGLKARDGGITV